LTFRVDGAILPGLMRRHAFCLLALLALPLAGCGNTCQDLGDRICACNAGGTTVDVCKQQVKNLLKDTGVNSSASAYCASRLVTCQTPAQPADVRFCEWVNTDAGKVACGLANPPVATSSDSGAP